MLLTIELLNGGDPKDIEIKLDKLIVEYSDIQGTNRLSYFVNQLLAAICNKQGNHQKQLKYLKLQLKIANIFPASYTAIVRHNCCIEMPTAFAWVMDETIDGSADYLLDPRIW